MSVSDSAGLDPTSDSFWEVHQYKRTVKRIDDASKLCNELTLMIQDRADIEKAYAKSLRNWSRVWNEKIEKGPEYGTTEAGWKGTLTEADRVAELHFEVKEKLVNDVIPQIKQWQKDHFHKQMMGGSKESKEMDENFRKAQKPWAKKLEKVQKARKEYHNACKQEKSANIQENNAKGDSAISPDHLKKIQDKAEKARRDVESTHSKYEAALNDINSYNAKYMEDMTEVFDKCQEFEEKRLIFFKEMLFGIHKCLDISSNPIYSQIYQDLHQNISHADFQKDLKFWSNNNGVGMAMNWPVFEEYSPELQDISKKKKKDLSGGGDTGITLTGMSYHRKTDSNVSDPPTQNPLYNANSRNSTDDNSPRDHQAVNNMAQSQQAPPKPPRVSLGSYDEAKNPFGDDDEDEANTINLSTSSEGDDTNVVDLKSVSEGGMTPGVVASEGDHDHDMTLGAEAFSHSPPTTDSYATPSESPSGSLERSTSLPIPESHDEQEVTTPVVTKQPEIPIILAPSSPVKQLEIPESPKAPPRSPKMQRAPLAPVSPSPKRSKPPPRPSRPPRPVLKRKSSYDPELNPFGDDDDDDNGNITNTSNRQSNASPNPFGDDWADEPTTTRPDVTDNGAVGVPVRALYDYDGQEEDELTFRSGDVFTKLEDEDEQGWCKGRKDNTVGLYPANYAEEIK
ncbi:unnamed protein product [Owenia fusiformis]|uniref:Uncharacterized protein n=1 Tax=Owenia fusiformis TaxID=6347 RepID=A0A8J1XVF9_OWEFU|nr:unnamed protein product [Owenia fusiformis]